jgi:hypothetical protein
MSKISYTDREIVKLPHSRGFGSGRTTEYRYAIRRIKLERVGWFKPLKKQIEWLKLRSMDDGHKWEYQKDYEIMNESFRNQFTVDSPETILQKWNHKPKSEEEKFKEKYGTRVDVKQLQQDLEEGWESEDNENRINRLGIGSRD